MCVIFACETEFPNHELLKNAEMVNPHGAGCAWLNSETREINFVKGIDADTINKMISKKEIELPCIIHFRITSTGTTRPELTHPAVISKDSELVLSGKLPKGHAGVLFLNGTVGNYKEIIKDVVMKSNSRMLKGEVNDTRVMAFASAIYGHEFLEYLDDSGSNKYAILDSNGITKYGNWHDETNGIKASNLYHRPAPQYNWDFASYGIDEFNDDATFEYAEKYNHKIFGAKPKPNTETDPRLKQDAIEKAREKISAKIQKLKTQRPTSKRQRKKRARRLRKSNIKFLKNIGWHEPERLSDESLISWVEIEQKRQSGKMTLGEYTEIFEEQEFM
jgi:hypothetical protein